MLLNREPVSKFVDFRALAWFQAIDMSALLDSWQKAAEATAKADASRDTEGMAAVKQVGELGGFGDIDGVVRLVRVAMEAIGH